MGMPNAYKVANEMIKDKMKESDMYDDMRKIKNPGWDSLCAARAAEV